MSGRVRAFGPATVANVGCAFDVLGFPLDELGDEVVVVRTDERQVKIDRIDGDSGRLPREAEHNTAGVAVHGYLSALGYPFGVRLEITKKMPLCCGLGSSAATAAAALIAVNLLAGEPLSRDELVPFGMEAERVACGSAHADNIAPALLGGCVLIRSYAPLDLIRISTPSSLACSVVTPSLELATSDSRKLLKQMIPLSAAVVQWGNVAGLVAGFLLEDFALIGRSLDDRIIEPQRSVLIPGFSKAKQAALEAGALGCSISGSGPSLFALSEGMARAIAVQDAMVKAYREVGLEILSHVSLINRQGAAIVLERGNDAL